MFLLKESIEIAAPPGRIWETLLDLERWWPASNPEHLRIEVNPVGKPIDIATEIILDVRVVGIKARAVGSIAKWIPEQDAAWVGTAVYRYYGLKVSVREGFWWSIEDRGDASILSAEVWGKFDRTRFGRLAERYAVNTLKIVDRRRDQARRELAYLRSEIECKARAENAELAPI